MCWNKEVSIGSFIAGIVGCLYLYKRNNPNDRWIALFSSVFILIQLAEFFMWMNQKCDQNNKIISIMMILILAAEPIANILGGLIYGDTDINRKNILKTMLVAYILFIAYIFFTKIYGSNLNLCGINNCSIDATTDKCNLRWMFLDGFGKNAATIWILFLSLPLLLIVPINQAIILFGTGAVTFYASKYFNTIASRSLWCWSSISVIFIKILIG